jgi:hypothetical protein
VNVQVVRDGSPRKQIVSAAKLLLPIAIFAGLNVWLGIAPVATAVVAVVLTVLSIATLRARTKWRSVLVTDRGLTLTDASGRTIEASLRAKAVLQVRADVITVAWMDGASKKSALLAKSSFSEESWERLSQAVTTLSQLPRNDENV